MFLALLFPIFVLTKGMLVSWLVSQISVFWSIEDVQDYPLAQNTTHLLPLLSKYHCYYYFGYDHCENGKNNMLLMVFRFMRH